MFLVELKGLAAQPPHTSTTNNAKNSRVHEFNRGDSGEEEHTKLKRKCWVTVEQLGCEVHGSWSGPKPCIHCNIWDAVSNVKPPIAALYL